MDVLVQLILSPFGVVGVVVAILLLAFVALYKLTKWATTITVQHDEVVNKAKDAEKDIREIKKDLTIIVGKLDILTNQNGIFAQSHSPMSLTPKGVEAASELNVDAVINSNWGRIKQDISEHVKDKNAYDIQQYCINTSAVEPEKFLQPTDISELKQKAYMMGVSVFNLSIVYAIKIRDRYFKEIGLEISEIDKYDPTKH